MAKKKGTVHINHDRCKVCGICVNVCPVKNYEIRQGKLYELDRCIACLQCEKFCPDMALIIEEQKNDKGPSTR